MKKLLQEMAAKEVKRVVDRNKYGSLDMDKCMLCGAQGEDKRSLKIDCFYDVCEVVPEMLDMGKDGYYLRICKACRGALLTKLGEWRYERKSLWNVFKDNDGNVEENDPSRNIPVRVNGAIKMLNEKEWNDLKNKHRENNEQ